MAFKFEPGDHVKYAGTEYVFHCYVTEAMAKEDFASSISSTGYAYLDSVEDDKRHDSRPSQNGRRYYCAVAKDIEPMPQNFKSNAVLLNELSI